MSIMEELKIEYKKACEEVKEEARKLAVKKYDSIIEKIREGVKKANRFITLSDNLFEGDYEIKEIVYDMLKKDGFIVREDEDFEYFEISGWASEDSPWAKILK